MIRRYVQNAGEVPPDEAYSLWQAEVYRCLRPLVDEWLGTGLNPDGSESPSTGDLFRTTRAVSAVLEYSKKHQARIKFTPGSTVPKLFIGEPHPFSDKWNDFFMEAAEEASRYFTALMASDWKAGLCQCRFERCSRYFLASRPRRSYRYGAFCCHEHQSLVSAGVCTSVRRARTAAQLIDLAAERFLKWRFDGPCWQNDANRKHRLAGELSMYVSRKRLQSYRQEVGVNWVTRHQPEIERRRAHLYARQLGTVDVGQQEPGEEVLQHPAGRLTWIYKATPEMQFIRVLTVD